MSDPLTTCRYDENLKFQELPVAGINISSQLNPDQDKVRHFLSYENFHIENLEVIIFRRRSSSVEFQKQLYQGNFIQTGKSLCFSASNPTIN